MIVLFKETPYQILCKVSVQNKLPDMSDLMGDMKYSHVYKVSVDRVLPKDEAS